MAGVRYIALFIFSWLGLLWERAWNRFWLAASALFVFSALAFFNVPLLFGPLWQLFLLGLFGIALALALIFSPHRFSWPRKNEVHRRLEKSGALPHRPLETLRDKPVEGLSDEAKKLWDLHVRQTKNLLSRLRPYRPQTDVAARDRFSLRYIALALLLLSLAAAKREAPARLEQAFRVDYSSFIEKKTIALDLWIVPPAYTHENTVFLSSARQGLLQQTGALSVPQGSTLKLRLSGLRLAPRMTYDGDKYPLISLGNDNYTLDAPLLKSGTLVVGSWLQPLASWPVTVRPDAAPQITLQKIEPTPRTTVKITYTVHDDHGIGKITGFVTSGAEKMSFDIPAPSGDAEAFTHTEDLSASPAAGQAATMRLEALDTDGHKTMSPPVAFTLPEREFSNPVAQRIIGQRKILINDANLLSRRAVAQNLAEILAQPPLYKGDITVFLALGSAVKRLILDERDEARLSTLPLLWKVAVKLEDGGFSQARQDLGEALDKLSQALSDPSRSKAELQQLIDNVQQKMREYVQSLARDMQQRLSQGQKMMTISPELAQKLMKSIDISQLLEKMRRLSEASSREELQKMAEELKDSIDRLDMKKLEQMQEKQMQALQALQDLENIIKNQQKLLDKTNKSDDPADLKDAQKEQTDIRQQLGETLKKLGEVAAIPDNFPKADMAMKDSAAALGKGEGPASAAAQRRALEELQKGQDSAAKQMAEQMQQSLLSFGGAGDGNFGEGFDPLGRPDGGKQIGGDIKMPEEQERRRVQQIIEELRHRSNAPNRSKVERDYIDRLLEQF